jgi:hypothetical protein
MATQRDLFDELAEEEPIRDTEETISSGSFNGGDRTLEDYEHNSPNLTELQSLFKELSPDFKDEAFNIMRVGRLSPDNFRPLFRLMVNNEIRRQRGKNVDVVKTATKIYTLLTMCLDGKHIIDLLEAYGSKASNTDVNSMSGMGLNG